MHVRKIIAATAVIGALGIGGGIAYADTAPPVPATAPSAPGAPGTPGAAGAAGAAGASKCWAAPAALARLDKRRQKIETHIDRAQKLLDAATAKHRGAAVEKLQRRLTTLRARRDTVVPRMTDIEQRCGVVGPRAPTTGA